MTVEGFKNALIDSVLNPLVGLLFALAVLYFTWGIFKFIANADNEEERRKGTQHMIWGIVGMFIMTAVWGILRVLANTVGVDLPS